MKDDSFEDEQLRGLFHRSVSRSDTDIKSRVMEKISMNHDVFEYKPVISKQSWVLMIIGFFSLIIFLFVQDSHAGWSFILPEKIDFSFLKGWSFSTAFFNWFDVHVLNVPLTLEIAVLAFVVFGLYFMVSFRPGNVFKGRIL